MPDSHRPGYYRDKNGHWHKDRRKNPDRRGGRHQHHGDGDRRVHHRRQSDLEALEREHREMVEEALKEFASHH